MSMRSVACLSHVDWLLVPFATSEFVPLAVPSRATLVSEVGWHNNWKFRCRRSQWRTSSERGFDSTWSRPWKSGITRSSWPSSPTVAREVSRLLCGAERRGACRHADAKEGVVCKGWAGQGPLVLCKVLQYGETGPGRESCRFCPRPQKAIHPGIPQWEYPVTCVVATLPHWIAGVCQSAAAVERPASEFGTGDQRSYRGGICITL